MAKKLLLNGGLTCPKCHRPMQRRCHKPDWKPKRNQPYYFSYWDVCGKCRHIQLYEATKVWVNGHRKEEFHHSPKPESDEAFRLRAIKEQLDDSLPWED